MVRPLSSLLIVLLLAVSAGATNYYVDTAGNDGNNGTSTGTPWEHLHKACTASVITGGDTIYIRAGLYDATHEGGTMSQLSRDALMLPVSGTNNATRIVWAGYPGDDIPVIRHTTASSEDVVMVLNSDANLTFRDLRMTQGHNSIIYHEGVDSVSFINMQFDTANGSGGGNCGHFSSDNQQPSISNVLFDSCTFIYATDAGNPTHGSGIQFYDGDSVVIRNSTFRNCKFGVTLKSQWYPACSCPNGDNAEISNVHIHNNTFYTETGEPGNSALNFYTGTIHDIYVHHNLVYGPFTSTYGAFRLGACNFTGTVPDSVFDMSDWYIYNNTIDCAGNNGIYLRAFQADGSDKLTNSEIFNNIIYAPKLTASTEQGAWCVWGAQQDGSCEPYPVADGDLGTGVSFDYNMYHDTTGTGHDLWWWHVTSDNDKKYTIAEMVTNTTHCDNDVEDDPEFTNRATRDYTISGSSPAASGGRGGGYPSYFGAFAPTGSETCPTITLSAPDDQDTVEATVCTLVVNVTLDAADDSALLTILWDYSSPPTTTLTTAPMLIDSTGHEYEWPSLLEDSTYYWRAILADTSCADTSAIRSFLVDSIPPVTAHEIRGVKRISGVKVIKP